MRKPKQSVENSHGDKLKFLVFSTNFAGMLVNYLRSGSISPSTARLRYATADIPTPRGRNTGPPSRSPWPSAFSQLLPARPSPAPAQGAQSRAGDGVLGSPPYPRVRTLVIRPAVLGGGGSLRAQTTGSSFGWGHSRMAGNGSLRELVGPRAGK